MLKENLIVLRKLNGYSQEQIAEKINISRQAYAKWENGQTVPDIEKAAMLAELYGVTLDSLIKDGIHGDLGMLPPAPVGKNIWGSVNIDEQGRIVIPQAARDKFELEAGTRLIVVGDEIGIALLPVDFFETKMQEFMNIIQGEK